MKKVLGSLLVSAMFLGLLTGAAQAADQNDWLKALQAANTPSFSADMVATTPNGNSTSKIFYGKDKVRMEMAQGGQSTVTIFDVVSQISYIQMDPKANTWMKMSMAGVAQEMAQEMPKPEIVKLPDEVVDGKPCEVSKYTYPKDGIVSTSWIWKGKNIPVKIVSVYQGKTSTVEYKNVEFQKFPDSLFAPPAGAQVTDLSQMMRGAGK